MPRTQRLRIWESILRVIEKDLQYLNQGYSYIDIGENKMIKISLENVDTCPITMMAPPYTTIHLACNHQLSIMAIYGIVYKGTSDDTESIVCPMCRRNLIPKLVPAIADDDIFALTVKSYTDTDIKIDINLSEFNFEQGTSSSDEVKTFTHAESNNYIDTIFDESNELCNSNLTNTQPVISTVLMNYIGAVFSRDI